MVHFLEVYRYYYVWIIISCRNFLDQLLIAIPEEVRHMMTVYGNEFSKVIGNVDSAHTHKLMLLAIAPSHMFSISLR